MFRPATLHVGNEASPPRLERRIAVRYPASRDTSCQTADPVSRNRFPAWVRDISATGIALLVEKHFPPETWFTVELDNPRQGVAVQLQARVVHTIEMPNDYCWLHGCAFERPLRKEELQAFID
jgi:hypothetical protein